MLNLFRGKKYSIIKNHERVYPKYFFPETRKLCEIVLKEVNEEAKRGAQEVLDWLNKDQYLLQASERDHAFSAQELLRPHAGDEGDARPETLLRGSDKLESEFEPTKRFSVWESIRKLFR